MEHILQYDHAAAYFEEALPLGNGSFGAMVYGDPALDRISLNHDTLWSGKPRHIRNANAPKAYAESKKLLSAGELRQAEVLLEQEFTSAYSQSYMPMGSLYIQSHQQGAVKNYNRKLDLQNATVTVRYHQGGADFTRTAFVSHPDNAMVLRITSSAPADYTITFQSLLQSTVTATANCLQLTGECPSSIPPVYDRDAVPLTYDGTGMKFAVCCAARSDGLVHYGENRLKITAACDLTLVVCAETSFIDFETLPTKPFLELCCARLENVLATDWDLLYNRHVADHRALYNRVQLELGFPGSQQMTDIRLHAPCKDEDLGLVELLYNYGRYLVIAASREGSQATNLQGIWNEHLFAPWSSNYTLNINTQMNYWPVLMNNLAGLDQPIIELTKKLAVTGARVARDHYGADGFCAHHNSDLWGHALPVGMGKSGCLRYAFWNMSAAWLCRHLWEHYEYTLDTAYLRATAWPLMQSAAAFLLKLLEWNGTHYVIGPTTSPENSYMHPIHGRIAIDSSSAMTQAIAMDLFANLDRAAQILEEENDLIRQVRDVLPYLNNYTIGSRGQLVEFAKEHPEHDPHHRHLSHLYGLFPGEHITLASTPALAEACRTTLQQRGDASTGWAMGWRVCLWAKLKDGDRALKLVKDQLRYIEPTNTETSFDGGTYPNLLDAHPPFQIDGNYGVCAGITLMFLQWEDGKIHLLPAMPTCFQSGSVCGLKTKGNITVDISWRGGTLTHYTLLSPTEQTVTVVTPTGEQTLHLAANQKSTIRLS